jgi:two-component system cell cycle sensor histidine kinase/response regulator CckA
MDLQRRARFVSSSRCGAYALIALGTSVLVGWVNGLSLLTTVLPGRVTMKPNTAIAFISAGIALVMLTRSAATPFSRVAAIAASSLVIAIGLTTLMEYSFSLSFSIDQLFFVDHVQYRYPGRMAQITALTFCFAGGSLLALSVSGKQAKWPQLLSLLVGFSATLAIIGYLYGVPALYGSIQYTSMAVHTGFGLLIMSAAILHCRPTQGLMQVMTSDQSGGWIARRLLPAAVIVPACLGAIYLHLRFSESHNQLAFASFVVTQIVLFVAVVWTLAYVLNRLEAEKATIETALEYSEELLERRYRTLFEQAIVGVFQSTPQGRFLDANPAMAQMFGYASPAEMMASINDIANQIYVDPCRRQEFVGVMEQNGAVQNFEYQVYRKDGSTLWVSANVRAVYEEGRIVRYEGTNSDITQRRLLQEQLAQSQKMEAVGRLAGGVAHDFNNAIGVITGYSALLNEHVGDDDKALIYTQQITKAGHRAASLTRQLLAFSRKQLIQPVVLDLNAVVSDIEKMLGRLIGEDVEMTVNLAQDLGHIKADRGQLEQVLMNLAVNARDAMPQGGKLMIETQNAELDLTAVSQHPCAQPGQYIILSVSDTGCGMDKETQSHIFEPFFTTKPFGKGTGLGLSTVYGIVQQNNGYIWVYSEPGKGARFKIFFPRISATIAQQKLLPEEVQRGSETVLLVEDDDCMRELTVKCLATSGYRVLSAATGEEAILVASEENAPIHLLLTDVVMPGLSGRQLAEALAASRPEMSVLYMSGYTADLIADHGIVKSNIVLLEKPFTREDLLRSARRVLDGKQLLRSALAAV